VANWQAIRSTVQRLIEANGRDVVIVEQGSDPQDSDKEWRGQADYDNTTVEGKAVFVDLATASKLGLMVDSGTDHKRSGQVLLFPASKDQGKELETFDVVRDGDVTWNIDKAQVLKPSTTRLLYFFEVSR